MDCIICVSFFLKFLVEIFHIIFLICIVSMIFSRSFLLFFGIAILKNFFMLLYLSYLTSFYSVLKMYDEYLVALGLPLIGLFSKL